MRLKRLELQGFKSFLDRTVLTFEEGITGVVGPNGCGKSNIVDAIQWVMGEQSAKHLRGESMTDVIFNGSDTRAATSMADVSLVLDRQGVALAPHFAQFEKAEEIQITRRVYRDGVGEYFINKVPCRLKDIHELFMDTGVGKRAYSIIEQGQIDRMISVKPDERRGLFEEVAGITKYKAKRKEAEKKLEGTRQNLLRLQDIILELEKQIRSLKIQATRAKKYRELKSELEAVDLYLLGRGLFEHALQVESLTERRNHLVNERSESDAQYASFEADITNSEILRIDQEKKVQDLGEKERNLSLLVQKLENQISLLEERRRHLQKAYDDRKEEEVGLISQIESLQNEMVKEESEKEGLTRALEELEAGLVTLEETSRREQENRQKAVSKKQHLENKRNQSVHRSAVLKTQLETLSQKVVECNSDRERLDAKSADLSASLESQKGHLQVAETRIQETSERAAAAEREAALVATECQDISSKLSGLEEKLYQTREEYHANHSRLESLKELQENLEGYSSSAREILLSLGEESPKAIPLAEVFTPEESIEDHLETLLGLDMSTLLVQTPEEAESLTRLIASRGMERVRVVAVGEIQQTAFSATEVSGASSFLSKVRIQPGYEAAAQWWLGKTYLVNNLDELFQMRRQNPELTFIAPDGQTVGHRDRSLTSGKVPTKTGVFARRREIEELEVVCSALQSNLNQLSSERENLLQHLQSQEKLHSDLKDRLSSIHIESVEHRKEREKLHFELTRLEREWNALGHEVLRNQSFAEDLKGQLAQAEQDLQQVTEESSILEVEYQEVVLAIEAAGIELEKVVAQVSDQKVEKSRLLEKQNSLQYKLSKMESDVEEYNYRLEQLRDNQLQDEKELGHIDSSMVSTRGEVESSGEEKNHVLAELSDVKTAFGETCTRLQDLRIQKDELTKKREETLQEIQNIELKVSHEQANLDRLRGISNERYHCDPTPLDATVDIDREKLPLFMEQLSVEWDTLSDEQRRGLLDEHLKSMREKIGRYGEVNLTAIQEFDEVQKRYEFLTEQRADLEKSIGILEEAIVRIEETTKIRFTETFEAVNEKFKEIFPILFNGGKAELTLVYSEGSTEPGVDIMAQPPGKRLQSITLLSGGEKALTAVSLVLSIFARKPSPFCLLDEVDAPLDDANVSRFNTVIKKMAEKTQFIVITHNKKTMEIAEALYGVTMERAGISKMTSVRLN